MLIPRIAVVPLFLLVVFCLLLSFGFDYKMRFRSFVAAAVAFSTTSNAQNQYTSTATAAVAAAKATAKTLSPTSSVPGKTFDRFVNIWLENTDFEMAAADRIPLFPYFLIHG
jgi:ACR3 family arsenite efflux pump ArsB